MRGLLQSSVISIISIRYTVILITYYSIRQVSSQQSAIQFCSSSDDAPAPFRARKDASLFPSSVESTAAA
jgi:hypothetical protein